MKSVKIIVHGLVERTTWKARSLQKITLATGRKIYKWTDSEDSNEDCTCANNSWIGQLSLIQRTSKSHYQILPIWCFSLDHDVHRVLPFHPKFWRHGCGNICCLPDSLSDLEHLVILVFVCNHSQELVVKCLIKQYILGRFSNLAFRTSKECENEGFLAAGESFIYTVHIYC